MLGQIGKIFLMGLVTLLPAVVTLYVLILFFASAESVFRAIVLVFLPAHYYKPGMGIAAGVVFIFLVGLFIRALLFKKVFDLLEALIYRIPLIKSLYGAIKDLTQFISKSDKGDQDGRKAVMLQIGNTNVELMGLVTRNDLTALPKGINCDDRVAVYLPMSYQLGGFTIYAPKASLRPLDMTVDQAIRFTMTAGMSKDYQKK